MNEPKTANMVKCKILDKQWIKRNGYETFLELSKARSLQSKGLLKIVSKYKDVVSQTVKNYKKQSLTSSNGYLSRTKFAKGNKIKIGWIQDYSKDGGAELSNQFLVSIGENLGFDIVGLTPASCPKNLLYEADLLIINNFFEFPYDRMNIILEAIYEKRIPYVKYDHDQREMKRADFARQLFTQSQLNVFISPLHKSKLSSILGSQILKSSICLPLAIDTKLFTNLGKKRIKDSVFIPTQRKCGQNVNDYISTYPNKKYFTFKQVDYNNTKIKIEVLQSVDNKGMAELYNMYEEMLHLPISFWAGERIYFEALLCGCKPIVNENVGHITWKFTKNTLKKKLIEAPFTFWKEIDHVCKA